MKKKVKDGVTVFKVRLVGDGRTHTATDTYSATPSKKEFLILIHEAARYGWDIIHIDESRAFLNSKYMGNKKIYTKLRESREYYEVVGALYGLRTSPKDYQNTVKKRMVDNGYTDNVICPCIYYKEVDGYEVLVCIYVDDYIFTGSNTTVVLEEIRKLREQVTTTDPIINPHKVLGLEIEYRRDQHCVLITMKDKIHEVYDSFRNEDIRNRKSKLMPMPKDKYILEQNMEDSNLNDKDKKYIEDTKLYMSIIGKLNWISTIRFDILLPLLYLSWHSQHPREHHIKTALYLLDYLYDTINIPLVMGGLVTDPVGYSDASVGTGNKGRSIIASICKMNERAGAVDATTTSSNSVHLSSYTSELEAATMTSRKLQEVRNICTVMKREIPEIIKMYSDNEAMISYIKGMATGKHAKSMMLHLYYLRENYERMDIDIRHMDGNVIPTDKLTKLGTAKEHLMFVMDIMGLYMLPVDDPLFGNTSMFNQKEKDEA